MTFLLGRKLNRRSLIAGSAIPALVLMHRAVAQDATAPSDETASELPAVDLPTMSEQGYTFELSSTFQGDLNAVPTEAPVYAMAVATYAKEDVQRIADALGLNGDVTSAGGDNWTLSSGEGSLFASPGLLQYISNENLEDGDLQGDDKAIGAAREWLRTATLLPPDVGKGAIQTRNEDIQRVIVTFEPVSPAPLVSASPNISVTLGPNNQVIEAADNWATISQADTYQLRGSEGAWAEVEAHRASVETTLPADKYQAGSKISGAAAFSQISLQYTTSGVPGEAQFLQPVYVFIGNLTPDGDDTSYPITAYVPALINNNQPVG